MKKYIKASFDPSMPRWLRNRTEYTQGALNYLKYNYAMSQAKFYTEPQPDSIPIHLLYEVCTKKSNRWDSGYHYEDIPEAVYIPGSWGSDNIYIDYGSTCRSVSNSSAKRLKDHIADTVYMVAPKLNDAKQGRDYVNPRYAQEQSTGEWIYQGQTPEYEQKWHENKGWVDSDKILDWSSHYGRDKSGYEIPNPKELYERLYKRFPDRNQAKIDKVKAILDEYYDKVEAAKNLIFSQYDVRRGKAISPYGSSHGSVFHDLYYAIDNYGYMCNGFEGCISEDGSVDATKLAEFVNGTGYNSLKKCMQTVDAYVTNINRRYGVE